VGRTDIFNSNVLYVYINYFLTTVKHFPTILRRTTSLSIGPHGI